MRIAIIGTRGIPNQYGGFEQFAEYLSVGLARRGHEVFVYNSHDHVYQQSSWKNVQLIHCYDPENKIGTAGQFIYDLNCVWDARKRNFDVILVLGYTSISVWGRLFPRKAVTVINMDGLEWKRTKYSRPTRRFLLYAEGLAVKLFDQHISDSPAIREYLSKKYGIGSEYIPYGAEVFDIEKEELLGPFGVRPDGYYMIMARMEPENNIEPILEGFSRSSSDRTMLVIGSTKNKFGEYLVQRFGGDSRIRFAGAVYDAEKIHTLKVYSSLYFHGHSVGGTNPSLLEAMASRALIAAHDNPFNRAIPGPDAFYFSTAADVTALIDRPIDEGDRRRMTGNNLQKIRDQFNWEGVIDRYEQFLVKAQKKR
jgi:glycosyltransferase involved in cell wall biosynthesis